MKNVNTVKKGSLIVSVPSLLSLPKFAAPKGLDDWEFVCGLVLSPEEQLRLRYLMFIRDYDVYEIQRFRYSCNVSSSKEELWRQALLWKAQDDKCRFPACPEFQAVCTSLLPCLSNEDRSFFLDLALTISESSSGIEIHALPRVIEILKQFKGLESHLGLNEITYLPHPIFF